MPKFSADQVVKQGHLRYFYQPEGAGWGNKRLYAGVSGQFLNIASATNPIRGSGTRINVQDPRRPGHFKQVGKEQSAPGLATATVDFMQHKGALPGSLSEIGKCITTFYQTSGDCSDPSDFAGGWSDYVKVLSGGIATERGEGGGSFDSDAAVMDNINFEFDHIYNLGKIGFGEKAAAEVYSEVIDITFLDLDQCGNCGPSNDGTKWVYAVTNNTVASAGEAPSIVFSIDGGATWTEAALTGSVSTDVPTAIGTAGRYLIVLFDNGAGGGYFVTEINRLTGVPGTFTKITNGFVTGGEPNDMFVENAGSVFFVGDGGYIYQSTSILGGVSVVDAGGATTANLARIDGSGGKVLVAVGASGVVIASTNGGSAWAQVDTTAGAANLTSVSVKDDYHWIVGAADGVVYTTETQGALAWDTLVLPGVSEVITQIDDIVFINDEVGFIAASSATPTGFLYTTMDGGFSWTSNTDNTPRISGLPTMDRINRLAYPCVEDQTVAANNLAAGGLAGNGSDGIIILGNAGVF